MTPLSRLGPFLKELPFVLKCKGCLGVYVGTDFVYITCGDYGLGILPGESYSKMEEVKCVYVRVSGD